MRSNNPVGRDSSRGQSGGLGPASWSPGFWGGGGGGHTENRRPGHRDTAGHVGQPQSSAMQCSLCPSHLPCAIPISCCHLSQLIDRLVSFCWAQEPPPKGAPCPEASTCRTGQHSSTPTWSSQARIVWDPMNEWTRVPVLGSLETPSPWRVFLSTL